MKKVVTVLMCSLLSCALSLVAFGRQSQGKITGTVKDPEGAAVSGANVSLLKSVLSVVNKGN